MPATRVDTWLQLVLELHRRHLEDPTAEVNMADLQDVTGIDDRSAVQALYELLVEGLVTVPSAHPDTSSFDLMFTEKPLKLTDAGTREAVDRWGNV